MEKWNRKLLPIRVSKREKNKNDKKRLERWGEKEEKDKKGTEEAVEIEEKVSLGMRNDDYSP